MLVPIPRFLEDLSESQLVNRLRWSMLKTFGSKPSLQGRWMAAKPPPTDRASPSLPPNRTSAILQAGGIHGPHIVGLGDFDVQQMGSRTGRVLR